MTMGEKIKQLRSANGFTQEMLAEKMNVSVRQLQNGKRQTKIIRIEKSEFDELNQMAIDGVTSCMRIREVNKNKKQFISLLLLADEQESMVDCYLEKGTMYVLEDNDVKAECVVTDEGNGILEIKNIAVNPENQEKGYGKALIDFLANKYADEYSVLQVGTGDSPLTIPFYEKCGFVRSHKIPNFFTDNYDHPIYEDGVQLIDMVYLQRHI